MNSLRGVPIHLRFWPKVDASAGPSACWVWTAGRTREGYGKICLGGVGNDGLAHRVSWQLHNGTIPPGLYVLHRCDNPPCVNPSHLFLGTNLDNISDMVSKGRQSRLTGAPKVRAGELNGSSKLTAVAVAEIRRLHEQGGMLQREIGERFGVNQATVSEVVRRTTWSHVHEWNCHCGSCPGEFPGQPHGHSWSCQCTACHTLKQRKRD